MTDPTLKQGQLFLLRNRKDRNQMKRKARQRFGVTKKNINYPYRQVE